jgi:glutamate dehydrogenase (NAD(P)+)
VNLDDVLTMISTKLRANAAAVLAEARRTEQTPHTAAQCLAQQRVLAAMRLRGQLPIDTLPEPLS